MVCAETSLTKHNNDLWIIKTNNNIDNNNCSGAPLPPSTSKSKSSSISDHTSQKVNISGANVPDISVKTLSPETKSTITPDKDEDVIMDGVDRAGGEAAVAAASASAAASEEGVNKEEGGSGGEEATDGEKSVASNKEADPNGEGNDSNNGEEDVKMDEADKEGAPSKGDDGAAEEKSNPTGDARDGEDNAMDVSGDNGNGADKNNHDASGENDIDDLAAKIAAPAVKKEEENGEGNNNDMDTDEKKEGEDAKPTDDATTTDKKEGDATTEKSSEPKDDKKDENEKEPPTPTANFPLLVGTLAYSDRDNLRRHIIRGNWKYEHSLATPPQRFELIRTIPPTEDLTELPKDGEFAGSFNVQQQFKTSKGKLKMKNRAVPESGVKLTFVPKVKGKGGDSSDDDDDDEEKVFEVKGTGINEFGVFELFGTATKNAAVEEEEGDTYSVSVHKKYVGPPAAPPAGSAAAGGDTKSPSKSKDKKRKHGDGPGEDEPKPPPTELPPEGICLRGKLVRNTSDELSLDNTVVHRITGLWAMKGLSKILEDPSECERFEYEHKSSGDKSTVFPLSGRYTGGFYVPDGPGGRTKVPEKDVTLKFKMNSGGYHNVEGKGSNIYGRYSITGTLEEDGTITLFRVFQAPKIKAGKKSTSVKISAPSNGSRAKLPKSAAAAAASVPPTNLLTFDDVKLPEEGVPPALDPPEQFTALSRGILKIEDDGTHTCSGSWAMTEEHFNSGLTAKYHFGIQAHAAAEDAKVMLDAMKEGGTDSKDDDRSIEDTAPGGNGAAPHTLANLTFPIDSTQYKGSFKLRKGNANRTQTIIDQQIVLKFVKNSSGGYNVYGKGQNEMGKFDLVGTCVPQGKKSGLMSIYRLYPQVAAALPVEQPPAGSRKSSKVFQGGLTEKATPANSGPAPAMKPPERFIPSTSGLLRRESSRMSRLPSRLEEDDPQAQMDRYMDRCRQILAELQEVDAQKFFAAPVDPVALSIPTYFKVIKEPMDLGTIKTRMDNGEIDSPEEFARLVRLTFQNAITFNTLPDNVVHAAARNLMVVFAKKFGSIDKAYNAARKNRKLTKAERQEIRRREKDAEREAKKKAKEEKARKRKAEIEAQNESKRQKVENVIAANKSTMAAIAAAAPSDPDANVTRQEYNLLLQAVKQVQDNIISLHKLVKKSKSSSSSASKAAASDMSSGYAPSYADDTFEPPKPKKKKAKKDPEAEFVPSPAPAPVEEVPEEPLSFEEQEALSEAINLLPERLLPGAMQIIREADFVNDDDDEIDLDIDQLDTRTQRKLQSFVMENVKPKKKKKQSKKAKAAAAPAPAPSPSPPPQEEKQSSRLPGGKSFFALGDDDDSDDDKEEEEDDLKADFATNWVSNPTQDAAADEKGPSSDKDDDEDDLWGAARKEAEASKARDEDRAKREEKMRAEAELAAQKRMAEAQELGEQARAKREEEEAAEARLREEQEREAEEARKAAREQAIKEVEGEQQTVDLDATRDLMRQYEQEFNDNYSAGASPSSDFGF